MVHPPASTNLPLGSGMAECIRNRNWGETLLGPIERWPQALRFAVDIMLVMPGPATILWGPQNIQLYNDAYITIARDRHPLLLGRPVAEGWPDVYDTVIAPLLDRVWAGRATQLTNFFVPLRSADETDDRVFDTDWVPIRDETGAVAGTLQTLVEVTDRLQKEAALRESETRHSLLIGSWAQAVWETDPNGVVIADSPSWRAYTGQTLQEWLGYGWLDAIHPDDRKYAERQWRDATARHRLVNAEFRLRAPDGDWRWTNVRAAPLMDAKGNIEKWVGMNINIDVRKRAEDASGASEMLHTFLLVLNDTLAPIADPVEIQMEAARVLGERTGADRVAYYETDGDDYVIEKDWPASGISLAGRHPIASFGQDLAEKLRRGEAPVVVADVSESHCEEEQRNFAAIGVGAYAAIPLVKDGQFVAGLAVYSAIPRKWAAGEVEMARQTAERTWAAIGRARAEAALRESEERRAFKLDLGDTLARLSDPAGMLATAARVVAEKLGVGWCYFNEFDERGTHAFVLADFYRDGLTSMVGEHDLSGEQSFLDLMSSKAVLDVSDLTETEQFSAQAKKKYSDLGIRSALGVPLLQGGRLTAVLLVADTHVRRWTRGEASLLKSVAERTWTAIERARAQASLRESEIRLQTLLNGIPQLVWRADPNGGRTWASPQWEELTGLSSAASFGDGWKDALHPDDRSTAQEAWSDSAATERLSFDCRMQVSSTGEYRWFQTRALPLHQQDGMISEWLGTCTDVHELRELQEQQQVLVGELQHRTRNIMAVIRSMCHTTARSSHDYDEFRAKYSRRLDALARVQGLLSRLQTDDRVTFDELLETELTALQGDETAGKVSLSGPRGIRLRSSVVQTLAMALHELTTNALKHGALGQSGATLDVSWTLEPGEDDGKSEGEPWLHIHWRESGVQMQREMSKAFGQGRELIERALPYQLGAHTDYNLGPEGVDCMICIQVSKQQARGAPKHE